MRRETLLIVAAIVVAALLVFGGVGIAGSRNKARKSLSWVQESNPDSVVVTPYKDIYFVKRADRWYFEDWDRIKAGSDGAMRALAVDDKGLYDESVRVIYP